MSSAGNNRWLRGPQESYVWWLAVSTTLALCLYGWTRPLPDSYTSERILGPVTIAMIIVGVTGVAVTWVRKFRRSVKGTVSCPGPLVLILVGAVIVGFIQSVRGQTQGYPVTQPLPWSFPLVLVLLLVRPPESREILSALRASTWVVAIAVLLDFIVIGPTLATAGLSGDLIAFRTHLQMDLFGLDGRWSGPFPNTHVAGMAGAWLIVWSLVTPRREGLLVLPVGLLCLALSDSRSGLIVSVTGALVLLGFSRLHGVWRAGLLVVGVAANILVVLSSPDGNGRLPIWGFHLVNAISHPLFGNGPVQIGHAHNTFIDTFSRYGLIAGLCLVMSVLWTIKRLLTRIHRWVTRVAAESAR